MPVGKGEDGVHVAGHARIMHRNHGSGPRGYGGLDLPLVDVQGVGPDIHETGTPPRRDKRVGPWKRR